MEYINRCYNENYKRWTGPTFDPHNLHSFNANIQNNTVNSLTFAGSAAEIGFRCDFLHLHSIKHIYLSSNMANYDRINPEGYQVL